MKLICPFEYRPLPRVTLENGLRHYQTPDGKNLPSVTSILSRTGDKSGLIAWKKRVGEAKAEKIRNEAAGLGTLMHTHLEAYIKNEPRPPGMNMVRQMSSKMADIIIECGLRHVDEIWGLEVPLYFPEVYAGTSDLIAVHQKGPVIIDYKTTIKMKDVGPDHDYFTQLSAYIMAHDELYGTKIGLAIIYMVDRDYNFKEFSIEGNLLDKAKQNWLRRVEEYYNLIS